MAIEDWFCSQKKLFLYTYIISNTPWYNDQQLSGKGICAMIKFYFRETPLYCAVREKTDKMD